MAVASMVGSLIEAYRERKNENLTLVDEYVKNILHGNSSTLVESYTGLVLYLHLFPSSSYFTHLRERLTQENFDKDPKVTALLFLYGAPIQSRCVFSWPVDDQKSVIGELLKFADSYEDHSSLAIAFIRAYLSHCKEFEYDIVDFYPRKFKNHYNIDFLHVLLKLDESCKANDGKMFKTLLGNSDAERLAKTLAKGRNDSEFRELCSAICFRLNDDVDTLISLWDNLILIWNCGQWSSDINVLIVFLSAVCANVKVEDCDRIPRLFSTNTGKLLSKKSTELLNDSALPMENCIKKLKENTKLEIIKEIITNTESLKEKGLGVRVIDIIKLTLTDNSVKKLADYYIKIIEGKESKSIFIKDEIVNKEFLPYERNYFISWFGKLTSHSCQSNIDWRTKQLKYLFTLGYMSKDDEIASLSEISGAARKVFFATLNQKFPMLADFISCIKKIVLLIDGCISDSDKFSVSISSQMRKTWSVALKCLSESQDGGSDDLYTLIQIVTLYMMLYMFKHFPTAKDAISEIYKVLKHYNSGNSDLHWSEVVVDLFLQLLSMSGQSHQSIILSVFGHVTNLMTPKALNQIIKVFKPEYVVSGHSDEDSDTDEDNAASKNGVNEDGRDSESEGEESLQNNSSNESDAESDISEDLGENANEELKMALREELYQKDTASTCGSVDLDNLDEEEGSRLNSALGKVFKDKSKGGVQKSTVMLNMHFKIRALLLLEIIVEKEPPVEYLLIIMSTLVELLKLSIPIKGCSEFCTSLKRVLKKCSGLRKFGKTTQDTKELIERCMLDIIKSDCTPSVYNDAAESISENCLLLTRLAYHMDYDTIPLINILQGIVDSYFRTTETIYPYHFIGLLVNSSSPAVVHFMPSIVYYAFSETSKPVKKAQAMRCTVSFYGDVRFFQRTNPKIDWDQIDIATVKVVKSCKKLLRRIVGEEFVLMNVNYYIHFFDLLHLLKMRSTALGLIASEIESMVVDALPKFPPFKGKLKHSFQQLCRRFSSTGGKYKTTKTDNNGVHKVKKLKISQDNANAASESCNSVGNGDSGYENETNNETPDINGELTPAASKDILMNEALLNITSPLNRGGTKNVKKSKSKTPMKLLDHNAEEESPATMSHNKKVKDNSSPKRKKSKVPSSEHKKNKRIKSVK